MCTEEIVPPVTQRFSAVLSKTFGDRLDGSSGRKPVTVSPLANLQARSLRTSEAVLVGGEGAARDFFRVLSCGPA